MPSISRDNLQKIDKLIGKLCENFRSKIDGDIYAIDDLGANYNLYSIISNLIGSTDYYNTIHVLSDMYSPSPMNLSYLEDPINFGYINADIKNYEYIDNTNAEIYFDTKTQGYTNPIEAWDYNFPPPVPYWFHDGTNPNFNWGENIYITNLPLSYPEWNGWPEITSGDEFPINNESERFPVFYLSKYIKITNNDSNPILNSNTIEIDAEDIISDSLWSPDIPSLSATSLNYEDIRIFRVKDTTADVGIDPNLPSGSFEEVARYIDKINGKIRFLVSSDGGYSIAPDEICYYIIYWRSPDIYVSNFDIPVYPGDNDATSYSLNYGLYYNYFYKNRHDIIDFLYQRPILKAKNRTYFDSNETDTKLYEPKDPVFYALGQLSGYVDDSQNTDIKYQKGFSINYRDINGDYYDLESVYSVIIGIKPYFDMNTYSTVNYSYIVGPNIFPDMLPSDLKDYNYYPEIDNGFIPFIKIIIENKKNSELNQNSPKSKILYIEYTKSYSNRGINNINFVNALSSSLYNIWNAYFNEYKSGIFSNILFYTYFLILALDIEKITESKSIFDIIHSHQKYIMSGSLDSIDENNNPYGFDMVSNLLSNSKTVTDDTSIKSNEVKIDLISFEPWFLNLKYWKEPSGYIDDSHFDFSDGTNWFISNARNIDSSRILLKYKSGDINYNDQLFTKQDRDDPDKTGLSLTKNTLLNPSKIEINFPKPETYNNNTSDSLNQDYTFKLIFVDDFYNTISKEIFLPNANYYISNDEYDLKISRGESITGYLTPSLVWSDTKYQEYGEAYYMPNCRNATNRDIAMKVFDPDDPNVKTIEEITTFCQDREDPNNLRSKGGKDAQIANDDINTCIQDTIDNEGVDIVDLRTISSKIISIKEFWLGVTKYTSYDPIWINDFDYLSGTREYDPETGEQVLQLRYGFTVDGLWYYQNYDKNLVINERNNFINTHLTSNQYVKKQEIYDLYNDNVFSLNGTVMYLAQTFTSDFAGISNLLSSVECWLKRVGAVNATIVARIYFTIDSIPVDLVSESVGVDFNSINEDGEWITFDFSTPVKLDTDPQRYAIVITSIEDPIISFSANTKLIWKFSSQNNYSYGITETFTFLSSDLIVGATVILVDDASIFGSAPFFILIDNDLYYIYSVNVISNELYFSDYSYDPGFDYTGIGDYPDYTWSINVISKDYSAGTMINLVEFTPLDLENRYYKQRLDTYGTILSNWLLPDYPGHDAAYRLMTDGFDVGAVTQPPQNEWIGEDISDNAYKSIHIDSFYITGLSAQYDITKLWGIQTGSSRPGPNSGNPGDIIGYSWGQGLTPPISDSLVLGGFNVAGVADFPQQNNIRLSDQNKIDRYWAWNTKQLEYQDQIVIMPQAVRYGDNSLQYIPFYNNIYLTIGLVKSNNTRKVVNKILFGYNSDYGTVSQIIDSKTIIVQSGYYDTISENQFTGKSIKFMDGDNVGNEVQIINCTEHDAFGNYLYKIELLNEVKTLPNIGDSYVILYSTLKCYDSGTITNVSSNLVTGYTTITDLSKVWASDLYNGYTLWIIDGDTPNTQITILDTANPSQLLIVNMITDISVGSKYIIMANDNSEVGVYGTNGKITIDADSDYIRVDHVYISSEGFPTDYMDGMGYNDSFIIRSKVDSNI